MQEKHVLEEAKNVARNAPVWPGDTLCGSTIAECCKRGWVTRDDNDHYVPTSKCPFQVVS